MNSTSLEVIRHRVTDDSIGLRDGWEFTLVRKSLSFGGAYFRMSAHLSSGEAREVAEKILSTLTQEAEAPKP